MHILRFSSNIVYDSNIGIVKKYSNDYFKLVHHYKLRKKGFIEIDKVQQDNLKDNDPCGWIQESLHKQYDYKLDESLSRTKSRIFELSLCNDWQYFITMTIDKEKFDRYNLQEYIKSLGQWLKNYRVRKNADIKYLLIPEQHKDGAWHIHGLINGLPIEHLREFTLEEHLPNRLRDLILTGHKIYNWQFYADKFGWVTLEQVKSKEKVSRYITKYITKDVSKTNIDLGNHLYYCSKGLNRAEVLYRGEIVKNVDNADFLNKYLCIKDFDNISDAFQYFKREEENCFDTI